eukprot:6700566-Prorocentrum_lima.AAC.1
MAWNTYWTSYGKLGAKVRMTKVKSHCTEGQLQQGVIQDWQFYLNSIADLLADQIATEAQVPQSCVQQVQSIDNT